MNSKLNTPYRKNLNVLMFVVLMLSVLYPHRVDAQSKFQNLDNDSVDMSIYSKDNISARPINNTVTLPANKVIYFPFDSETTAKIANTYSDGYHQGALQYSIDFFLHASYGGDDIDPGRNNAYIYPIASGTVLYSGWLDGYGNVVYISHSNSLGAGFVSVYGHMKSTPVVKKDDPVTVNSLLGIQGKTGAGIPAPNTHLHLSLVYCSDPNEALKKGAGTCNPVKPEPMIGKYANEKFNWWPNTKLTQGIGTYTANGNRDISPTLLSDTTFPEEGWWNSGTTLPNSQEDPLLPGQPMVFDVHYNDFQSGVGEVRLTAYYNNWHADPDEGAWRIIARCRPSESPACSETDWHYEWNWANETVNSFSLSPLEIPWMTNGMKTTLKAAGKQSVCISFDVFDLAGNPRYAPQGTQCGFTTGANTINAGFKQISYQSQETNEARLIYVDAGSAFRTTDQASFIMDLTITDNTIVTPAQLLNKTWRVKNSGSTAWNGYKLKFVDGEQMGGPAEITIPTTSPGQTVDLSINIVSPSGIGTHSGSWQIVNNQGGWVSGGKLWVTINVKSSNAGSGSITMFDVSPASPSSASTVHLVGRIKPSSDFRSMRFLLGNEVQEMTNVKQVGDQLEISYDWNTSSLARGNYTIALEVAKNGDNNWSNAERQVKTYTLIGTPASQNRPPDRPALKSPYDWYLKDAAGASAPVELCVHPSSDPDGNPVQYWFEVKDQGGGVYATSGWTTSTCWTNTYAPNTYSWRVKTGDGAAESDWSADTWHFSVAGGGVYIGSDALFDPNTDNTHLCVFVTYDGIIAPNVRAWINEATDGSENGEWRQLDHYGPNTTPDCTQSNYHGFWIRSTVYETGNHALRISAVKSDSGNSATKTIHYNIAYIRPPTPVLVSPSTITNNGTWWNDRTIHFEWKPSMRADNYTLRVSTNSDPWSDPSPILNQVLGSDATSYDHTFGRDYDQLYWSVRASNSAGSADTGSGIWFGIDQVPPACQVEALPSTTYSNVFQVNWSGTDNSAGIQSADIQFMDSERGTWEDWLTETPFDKTYDLFNGQLGHTYFFRCRATDNAGNTGEYPASADTSIIIDPFTRPGTPWWDVGYAQKRNLVILNNMPSTPLPQGYPIHLRFDGSTTPTSAELYAASLSTPKCNDLRVIYNDAIELDRVVQSCTSNTIDIWFRTQVSLLGSATDSTSHQLYYGNAGAGTPAADPNKVWYPYKEADTTYLYFLQEGSGSTAYDYSGNGRNCSINSSVQWSTSKFANGLRFNRANYGDSRSLNCGSAIPLSAFTIEFWYKPDTDGDGRVAGELAGGGNGGGGNNWVLSNFEGKMRLDVWPCPSCGSAEVRSNFSLRDAQYAGKWNYIAVTFNGGNQVRFYINGNLDSTKTLSQSGINTFTPPLEIGSAEGISQLKGNLGAFKISNVVKTSFPYASFTAITNEPTTATDAVVTPPETGEPDLVILSLATYPNPTGGVLVEAVVENQGDLSTKSGFYTDLYLDYVPTGSGDYSSSLRFWINDPIDPGETVTLTTVITDLSSLPGAEAQTIQSLNETSSTFTETSGTLYAQTDSVGLVQEPNDQNNIYSTGTEICTASPDSFEGDGDYTSAYLVNLGDTQTHNFSVPDDEDWVKFNAQAGTTYRISTGDLGISSDTYLYLYDTDGATLLASNDDSNDLLTAQLTWVAPQNGTYYILVKHWNPNVGGCGTQYSLSVDEVVYPAVTSILRADPDPTGASSVNFTVTFSENVTGVDETDFVLNTTGVNGASITNAVGSDATYTVTVGTGSGDGTIRLDLLDDNSILNLAGDPLGGTAVGDGDHIGDETYTLYKALTPLTPTGTLTSWDNSFSWVGLTNATWYLLEVQTSGGTQVFRKWYTSTQTNCAGGTDCSVTPTELSLANGDYKWRVMDYGAYGYGTNSAFKTFTLDLACYTLTTTVSPAGSGVVNTTAQNCGGGYTEGTVVQLEGVPNSGYQFEDWSGDAAGMTNPVSVTMNGDKSVTANFKTALTPVSPSGTLSSWDKSFTWTGLVDATWYLIEVQTGGGTQVFRKWYTSAQTNCTGGTNCSVIASELSLTNGEYKWRVLDYGVYGYGTNSAFKTFTLDLPCYTLTTAVLPAGGGTVNASAPNCGGGYTAGTVVQLTAVPNTGYLFNNWTGDVSSPTNPLSVTMNGNRSITANFKSALLPLTPTGTLTSWDKSFTWTGLTNATWYLIEVQTAGGTQVFRKWYTSAQTNCAGGTNCSVTAGELSLANGEYKWRVLDYGAYGYGTNSAFKAFSLNVVCYTLTTNVDPGGSGVVNVSTPNCGGGYTAGTVVQLTAVPNSGYVFKEWGGDAGGGSNPGSVTMNGDKSVTANFKATVVLNVPSGTLTSWDNTFSWTGLSDATWYLIEVYTPDGTQVFRKWYTSAQTGCTGSTACSVVPPETAGLAAGGYKWRMLDYGAYGYGTWTGYLNFSIP